MKWTRAAAAKIADQYPEFACLEMDKRADAIEEIIIHYAENHKAPISLEVLLGHVAKVYHVPEDILRANSNRRAHITKARYVFYYIAKKFTTASLKDIGRFAGNRDHSTVLHGIQEIERRIKSEGDLKKEVEYIKRLVGREGK